jgi:hypothetical protein
MDTVPGFAIEEHVESEHRLGMAKSSFPSPLKSPVAAEVEFGGEKGMLFTLKDTLLVELVTGSGILLEAPPPGAEFTTVTLAVVAVAIMAARTVTVQEASCGGVAAVQVVGSGRGAPFQKIADCPLMNPAPRTVSAKSIPPGATAVGEIAETYGTGLETARSVRGLIRAKRKSAAQATGRM